MKKIFNSEYSVASPKMHAANRVFSLTGTAFTMDAHAILHRLSTPFFPRR